MEAVNLVVSQCAALRPAVCIQAREAECLRVASRIQTPQNELDKSEIVLRDCLRLSLEIELALRLEHFSLH